MASLTVVLNICNEAAYLPACLESVRWADEIVVTDMQSTDDGAEICAQYGARVLPIPWEPIADRVHNIAFSSATSDWVLKLDPDERVSPALAAQLLALVSSDTPYAAFRLPFKDRIFGKWIRYTGWQGNREVGLIRLFERNSVTWMSEVHSQPEIDGPVGQVKYDETLDNGIEHLNYTSVSQFIEKLNRYTSAEACKRVAAGKHFRWYKLAYHPLVDFWRRYVSGQGFRDGMHGLILSVLMAIYAEVILIKMWELEREDPTQ